MSGIVAAEPVQTHSLAGLLPLASTATIAVQVRRNFQSNVAAIIEVVGPIAENCHHAAQAVDDDSRDRAHV